MPSRTSTVGVVLGVVAVLVGAFVPAGTTDCLLCTRAERVLLAVAAVGAAVGTVLALVDRPWAQRLGGSLLMAVVGAALALTVRLAT